MLRLAHCILRNWNQRYHGHNKSCWNYVLQELRVEELRLKLLCTASGYHYSWSWRTKCLTSAQPSHRCICLAGAKKTQLLFSDIRGLPTFLRVWVFVAARCATRGVFFREAKDTVNQIQVFPLNVPSVYKCWSFNISKYLWKISLNHHQSVKDQGQHCEPSLAHRMESNQEDVVFWLVMVKWCQMILASHQRASMCVVFFCGFHSFGSSFSGPAPPADLKQRQKKKDSPFQNKRFSKLTTHGPEVAVYFSSFGFCQSCFLIVHD